ncbi:DUF1656 domain-containing protein [Sphingomonas sp. CGMCC 1.13654]|uniref:DUF1656 domain-containing protein n=1 Tax=Sphingomonas chungangi TaxID=2683589 RepID=A0A838L498_9SPHN|nr:DUF1656 domain-containing protein [Sphingomonas chungangi]MBA2932478.1 DUF1656 domain-containing protein [Sphingomonas chungangi]MVW56101.1 DUF1656 domain-containing protein [Sphingomonas chungangi]
MTHDFLIGGIILSPIVPELLIALLLTGLLSVLLMRLGFYRLVWHRPLVELSMFCIILGTIVAFTPDDRPFWHVTAPAGSVR